MSDELHHRDDGARFLREEERSLLLHLLPQGKDFELKKRFLDDVKVRDMPDGAMGSIEFICENEGGLGKTIVEAEFFDVDGVVVSVSVNENSLGDLYEMDFWKSDFSPLLKYPAPEDVKIL